MKKAKTYLTGAAALAALASSAHRFPHPAAADPVLFWSDQGTPVEEQQRIRDNVLSGFDGEVDFQPQDPGPYVTRIQAEAQAGKGTIDLIGGLHGDFASFSDAVMDLSDLAGSLCERRRQRDLSRPRQARHRRAEVHSVDAGDLHHGRQQEGARISPRRRRHQRAHL